MQDEVIAAVKRHQEAGVVPVVSIQTRIAFDDDGNAVADGLVTSIQLDNARYFASDTKLGQKSLTKSQRDYWIAIRRGGEEKGYWERIYHIKRAPVPVL